MKASGFLGWLAGAVVALVIPVVAVVLVPAPETQPTGQEVAVADTAPQPAVPAAQAPPPGREPETATAPPAPAPATLPEAPAATPPQVTAEAPAAVPEEQPAPAPTAPAPTAPAAPEPTKTLPAPTLPAPTLPEESAPDVAATPPAEPAATPDTAAPALVPPADPAADSAPAKGAESLEIAAQPPAVETNAPAAPTVPVAEAAPSLAPAAEAAPPAAPAAAPDLTLAAPAEETTPAAEAAPAAPAPAVPEPAQPAAVQPAPAAPEPAAPAPAAPQPAAPQPAAPEPVQPPKPLILTPDASDATPKAATALDDGQPSTLPGAGNLIARAPGTARLPQIGKPGADVAGSLPQIGKATPAAEAAAQPVPAYAQFARAFAPQDPAKPLFVILLRDLGAAGMPRADLADLPFPVSVVLDPLAPDAAEAMRAWRDAGQEVVLEATGLPEGAQAVDVAQTFQALTATLPETVAVIDLNAETFQNNRPLASLVVPEIQGGGRGLVTWDSGLDAADQIARRSGVPSVRIFRRLDGSGESGPTMLRYLDRAVFKAQQQGAVVVLGDTRVETLAAILQWTVEGKASSVTLAPLSAALTAALPR